MRRLPILALLVALPTLAFGQVKATIAELSGKVEVKAAGAAAWTPAAVGMKVDAGTTISTGFKSVAVLKLADTSLTVKALTRLSLKELVEKEGTVDTNLYLTVGKVKADVKPIAGKTQTFTVASPVSTASVRGTSFDFDGVNLSVQRGQVDMISSSGQSVPVESGESAAVDPESSSGEVQDALDSFLEDSSVATDLSNDDTDPTLADALAGVPDPQDIADQVNQGLVTIKINY